MLDGVEQAIVHELGPDVPVQGEAEFEEIAVLSEVQNVIDVQFEDAVAAVLVQGAEAVIVGADFVVAEFGEAEIEAGGEGPEVFVALGEGGGADDRFEVEEGEDVGEDAVGEAAQAIGVGFVH